MSRLEFKFVDVEKILRKFYYWIMMAALLSGVSPALAETPTTTSLPPRSFATITVKIGENPDINVRAGPGVDYERVGTLLAGQEAPALGRSAGGDWVQISFPEGPEGLGWVYTYLVDVNGELPIVIPPATPTPRTTPTIDPTLAAQFIIEPLPTALPTFTAPPPLVIPTIATLDKPQDQRSAPPLLYIMIVLGALGLFSLLVSFIRVR
ncbi:MAG: SH3 domain-containing protein [Anaerolineales bacterium]|jgi:uncharacterized protein YraI